MGWTSVYTTDFSGGSENPLSEGGKWQTVPTYNAMQVLAGANAYRTVNSAQNGSLYTNSVFNDNQYSNITYTDANNDGYQRVGVRWDKDSASANGYYFTFGGTDAYLQKVVAGSETTMGSSFTLNAKTIGDKYKIQAQGTSLTAYHDEGSGWGTAKATRTDAAFSSGYPGLFAYAQASSRLDDFEAGHYVGLMVPIVVDHLKQQGVS